MNLLISIVDKVEEVESPTRSSHRRGRATDEVEPPTRSSHRRGRVTDEVESPTAEDDDDDDDDDGSTNDNNSVLTLVPAFQDGCNLGNIKLSNCVFPYEHVCFGHSLLLSFFRCSIHCATEAKLGSRWAEDGPRWPQDCPR
jgi:hypothetical protein